MPRLRQETGDRPRGKVGVWNEDPDTQAGPSKSCTSVRGDKFHPLAWKLVRKPATILALGRGEKILHKKSKPQFCALCRFRALIGTVHMLQNSETQNSA